MQNPTTEENVILAAAIAINLGNAWVPQKNTCWWGFGVEERTSNKKLWFRWEHGKWVVSVHIPRNRKNEEVYIDEKQFPIPSCKLSAIKTPEQIIKDLNRRIFPQYETLLAEVERRVEQHNNAFDRHDNVKKQVEQTTGIKFRPDCHNSSKTDDELYLDKPYNHYNYTVKVESGKIALNCTFADENFALEIIKQIQQKLKEQYASQTADD